MRKREKKNLILAALERHHAKHIANSTDLLHHVLQDQAPSGGWPLPDSAADECEFTGLWTDLVIGDFLTFGDLTKSWHLTAKGRDRISRAESPSRHAKQQALYGFNEAPIHESGK